MITPDNRHYGQVRLLVRVLPHVAAEPCFALKGGTAINLFIRDLPRLSVDIDLAYVPVSDYDSSRSERLRGWRRYCPEFNSATPNSADEFRDGGGERILQALRCLTR